MINHSHYCNSCKLFFACTHNDPEKQKAKCPNCGKILKLNLGSIESVRSELQLSLNEIGTGIVTYTPIKP